MYQFLAHFAVCTSVDLILIWRLAKTIKRSAYTYGFNHKHIITEESEMLKMYSHLSQNYMAYSETKRDASQLALSYTKQTQVFETIDCSLP